jgi:hypothetical protein
VKRRSTPPGAALRDIVTCRARDVVAAGESGPSPRHPLSPRQHVIEPGVTRERARPCRSGETSGVRVHRGRGHSSDVTRMPDSRSSRSTAPETAALLSFRVNGLALTAADPRATEVTITMFRRPLEVGTTLRTPTPREAVSIMVCILVGAVDTWP